jgi:transposase-like protein DUF772
LAEPKPPHRLEYKTRVFTKRLSRIADAEQLIFRTAIPQHSYKIDSTVTIAPLRQGVRGILPHQPPISTVILLGFRIVDLESARVQLAPFYSSTGRPSIDPELMVRMLIVGCRYGTPSERRLCEEV